MEFEEKQRLNLWWLYILIVADAIMVTCIVLFDKGGMSFQDLKGIYFAPVWAVLFPFAIVFAIQKSTLTLSINQDGISYRYFPFKLKLKLISWDSIQSVYINKYDAFSDYGGYGFKHRLWFNFRDKAYILNNQSKGLQIEFKDGKKLLFSSNKIEEMELFLINLKTRYHIQAIS